VIYQLAKFQMSGSRGLYVIETEAEEKLLTVAVILHSASSTPNS
jgi:hypothetical protein